ncbi:MAG: Ig-like domain-containing protein [candidate division KSB1 bacterium]|nr:Ig-like domain-containing protein [candidate division KSB1 bacterium]MDZ7274714.1 Ig-like domain-containing protein [candidate division KSB1 bacterium]MDZ7285539.1 Ig-like domain-containing protein [candidate division KSB1 bacterium]MDZ7298571.1 Ig-like domain-containing protein [candidate division KSB1 bacterium]MDZ7309422.1 Ig-like domain-containing protein [candidate division KSB1 bacterium]
MAEAMRGLFHKKRRPGCSILPAFSLLLLAGVGCSKKISPNLPDPYPDLHLVSISPGPNATGVPTQTSITLTFSAEMSLQNLGLILAPTPPGFFANWQLSADARQISVATTLAPNTTYSLVVFAANDRYGDYLRTPFVSRFATGSSIAGASVSGTSVKPFNQPLQCFAGLLTQNPETILAAAAPDEAFYEHLAAVSAITDTSGKYSITGVAAGVYWPFAALDVNRDGRFRLQDGDQLQGHDANADQALDSVTVAATALTQITLQTPVVGLKVVSTFPVNGQKNVPLNTTFRLTFTTAVDSSRLGLFIAPIPEGLTGATLRPSADRRELSAPVTLKPNTVYTAVLYTATSTRGQMLQTPQQVTFTTGTDFPGGKVQGRVLFRGGGISPRNTLVALLNTDLLDVIQQIFPNPSQATAVLRKTLAAISYVPMETGEFVIANVPDGTYWPVGAKDTDLDGSLEPTAVPPEPIGFYDRDGDQAASRADSVVVSNGTTVSNITIVF